MRDSLTDARAENALGEVLSEPPFTGGGFGTEGLWRRLWDLLVEWYEGLVLDLYDESPVGFWVLMLVLVAVLSVLIWHITISVREVWRSIKRAGELQEAGEVTVEPLTLESAETALAAADYRRAVELAWSTAARALRMRIGPTTGETPRQQARMFQPELSGAQAVALDELVRVHEQACYSGAETSDDHARYAVARAGLLMTPGGGRGD